MKRAPQRRAAFELPHGDYLKRSSTLACGHAIGVYWRRARGTACLGPGDGGCTVHCGQCGEIQALGSASDRRVPRDELHLAEDITWVEDISITLGFPPSRDGSDTADVLAEIAAWRSVPSRRRARQRP